MRAIALGTLIALSVPFISYAENPKPGFTPIATTSSAPADAPSASPTAAAPTSAFQTDMVQYNAALAASQAGDDAKAFALMEPLVDKGYDGAMYYVGIWYLDGKGIKKNVQAGLDQLTQAANAGHFDSQMYLAAEYLVGIDVTSDYGLWAKWMDMAYKQNPSEALSRLDSTLQDLNANGQGWVAFYLYGTVPKDGDYNETLKWALASANNGGSIGEYVLATLYDNGYGTTQDFAAASKFYSLSAAQDFSLAENDLAVLYEQGAGVPRDFSRALKLYTQAANHGLALAQTNLCRTYGAGRGVPIDLVQAYKWCNLAAAQGDKDAKSVLDSIQTQMSLDQVNEAQRLSAAWTPTAQGADATPGQENGNTSPQVKGHKQRKTLASAAKSPKLRSSGTGFYVTADGYLVTNAHVIDECTEIRAVNGSHIDKLTLIVEDVADDLALLSSNEKAPAAVIFRDGSSIQIGEHIVVFGYPLPDVLSGQLTLTDGSVSALGGLGGAVNEFQFSAPIQPGNSGGPILDVVGRVVGMSVAKLNSITMAKVTGDVPQNVNFAINEQTLRAFLDIHSVHYNLSSKSTQVSDTILGQQAKNYTVMLQCWK